VPAILLVLAQPGSHHHREERAVSETFPNAVTGPGSTVLGYPRIGPDRELKFAVEGYWAGDSSASELQAIATELRRDTWAELAAAGLESVPSNTFSFYDHVLDAARVVGAVPDRFVRLGLDPLDEMFAMARGHDGVAALRLLKWFDTNYHYLVPELEPSTSFRLADTTPIDQFREALDQGVHTRPVLIGPVTFLLLSSTAPGAPTEFDPLDLLDSLLDVYAELLARLATAGAEWVQLDEPAFVADRTPNELAALERAYARLGEQPSRPRILVASYFGHLGDALPVLAQAPIEALAVDLVDGTADKLATQPTLQRKALVLGLVDGRNVWRTDLKSALATATSLLGTAGRVDVSTSSSLLHVPYDLDTEPDLDPAIGARLSFARQKVTEVVALQSALRGGRNVVDVAYALPGLTAPSDESVRARLADLGDDHYRRGDAEVRRAAQHEQLGLPPLPTTTIGSFPQTASIRSDRAAHRSGHLDDAGYEHRMHVEIARVIALQEDIGLDVLVHGEPERNDMVEYFAEHLEGFLTTRNGVVQSYGSRCVRPPILFGDVSRAAPITVGWSTYAQSLTARPVKAMLTGPVTILAWSFVRIDQPLADTARQVGLALRDEVRDLEAAGLRIIQVDEPALRELLPLRAAGRQAYIEWAIDAFRVVTGAVADSTQIHTHLCYSEFSDVVAAIDGLDADVTTVEAARSRMTVLAELGAGVPRGLGPGVYDVHSPQVPAVDEITSLLIAAQKWVDRDRLWVNPDCGLKTRGESETEASLRNLVAAAAVARR
jgi:5-methyltetrahydropteroyltriglutamate--homocysteine methyltransferase